MSCIHLPLPLIIQASGEYKTLRGFVKWATVEGDGILSQAMIVEHERVSWPKKEKHPA
jgi:hypothetical protein